MRPYDDKRYLKWCQQLTDLVIEYLDTEGNDETSLLTEVENAIENAREALE